MAYFDKEIATMGHVFISYSRKDVVYAAKLVDALRREGFNVWIDMDLRQGTQWDRRLENQLKKCAAYLLIVSPNSHKSDWVRKELLFAQTINKPVFPLILEETDPWLAILDVQHTPASNGGLPPQSFYEQLAKIATRDKRKGSKEVEPKSQSTSSIGPARTEELMETTRRIMRKVSRFAQDSAKNALEKTNEAVDAISNNPVVKSIFPTKKRTPREKPKRK